MNAALNVILPIAGPGDRFARCRYDVPKPLTPVLGEPMVRKVVESLGLTSDDHLLVIHHGSLAQENLQTLIGESVPDVSKPLHRPRTLRARRRRDGPARFWRRFRASCWPFDR